MNNQKRVHPSHIHLYIATNNVLIPVAERSKARVCSLSLAEIVGSNSYEYCVLSGRGLCDGAIPRPGESYRLCCVSVCDSETSSNDMFVV